MSAFEKARRPHGVGHARHKRRLRADHHEIDAHVGRVCRNSGRVLDVERHGHGVALECGAAIARRGEYRIHVRRAGERFHDGVLAPTGSKNQNLHAHRDAFRAVCSSVGDCIRAKCR
jgi:hypothetical protein